MEVLMNRISNVKKLDNLIKLIYFACEKEQIDGTSAVATLDRHLMVRDMCATFAAKN